MSRPPHPLEASVRHAFRRSPVHDVVSLSVALAGANWLGRPPRHDRGARMPRGHANPMHCYEVVAMDVLGVMAEQGLLRRDPDGWFRLTEQSGGAPVSRPLPQPPTFGAMPSERPENGHTDREDEGAMA
jgi:hypothetical protein